VSACKHPPARCVDPVCGLRGRCLYGADLQTAANAADQRGSGPGLDGGAIPAVPLNRAQRRFLALHAATPAPHRWTWLSVNGAPVYGHPGAWAKLRAWRHTGDGRMEFVTVSRSELKGLGRYFAPFPTVNEAGHLVLEGRAAA
jgi:hypothetical protein